MEEKYQKVEAQPAHKLAVPLFIFTSIPYFITLAYDFLVSEKPDSTFAWFGAFYLALGGLYLGLRYLKRS
ncbi:hypothetical protein BFP97_00045 [Roseivirga sp. 4D4]|uniref:hypothetical protein n=1 Tax=Roseivirga sp. 4D4 TaxID=1889784 RepID=UPI000852D986|nr:hypothetical protein [Roseivirga sp. 4D4]OEK00006.1 hypothetical protein BFP97_00045 [Roseivirga sp. 4D4]